MANYSNNALMVAAQKALPALASGVQYNSVMQMFLSPGYTSQAGNHYYEGLRLSKYLAVEFDLGRGWLYTFLNGVRLYSWEGNRPKLIASCTLSNCRYSESIAMQKARSLLLGYLKGTCAALGAGSARDAEIEALARQLLSDTVNSTKLLAQG